MPFSARGRIVNPKLGTYFSIFASLFVAMFLLTLIFDQLAVEDATLRAVLFAGLLLLCAVIGVGVATNDTLAYFAAGRRVPAVYGGLVLALSALGSTFVVAGTGVFFFAGFDALVLLLGSLTGLVLMAVVLAPYYRKFGAFTLPSYLGRRFDSRLLRYLSALIAVVAMVLVLSAELRIGALVAARLTGLETGVLIPVLAIYIALTVGAGGQRSATWMAVAQAIAFLLALMIVATTVSLLVTNLPIPQLANGPLVRGLVRHEGLEGLPSLRVWPMAFEWPGEGFTALSKPYTQTFGTVGSAAFILATLSIAGGFAAAPWLLPRVASAPGVYEARKALGWATVFAGLTLLTISSLAIFQRDFVLDAVMDDRIGPLPDWLAGWARAGIVQYDAALARVDFSDLKFSRDGVLFGAPLAAGLPPVFSHLMAVGAVAIALLAMGATTASLANVLAEDVAQGMRWEPLPAVTRVWLARMAVGIATLATVIFSYLSSADPLHQVLWALSLTGGSLFPVLVLSIWWKRVTALGALTGVAGGFVAALALIHAGATGMIGVPAEVAGCLAMAVSTALAMTMSVVRPEASRHALEVVRDIRVPGGDIIYDREMQRLHLKKHARK